jgi:predicted nucleic acid-binding protein
VIVYIDSSFLLRSYLVDEIDHAEVRAVLADPEVTAITGSWTRVEVTGSLVRAARAHRGAEADLLALFDADTAGDSAQLTLVDASQAEVELIALQIVRRSGIRSLDAWHLACAILAFEALADPGEQLGFATRDAEQAAVARELGFATL